MINELSFWDAIIVVAIGMGLSYAWRSIKGGK